MVGRTGGNGRGGMHRTGMHRTGIHHTGPQGHADAVVPTRTAESAWPSLPWIAVLVLTAGFHFYRDVPVDAGIFLAMAVVLTIDLRRKIGARSPGAGNLGAGSPDAGLVPGVQATPATPAPPARSRTWLAVAILTAAAAPAWAVLVLAPRVSLGIPAVVALIGVAMLVRVWRDPPRPEGKPAPRVGRAAYWWGGVVLFLCLWELGTYFVDRFAPSHEATIPPLTDLLQPLFDADASRWLMTGLWLLACGALVRVVRRP